MSDESVIALCDLGGRHRRWHRATVLVWVGDRTIAEALAARLRHEPDLLRMLPQGVDSIRVEDADAYTLRARRDPKRLADAPEPREDAPEWEQAGFLAAVRVETWAAELQGVAPKAEPTHSPDFTSVDWFGTRHTFTKGNQAETVRLLWEAWESGGHSLSQGTIKERIETSGERFELAKVFRKRRPRPAKGYVPHPAWGTMIQQSTKGSYRLVPPESA